LFVALRRLLLAFLGQPHSSGQHCHYLSAAPEFSLAPAAGVHNHLVGPYDADQSRWDGKQFGVVLGQLAKAGSGGSGLLRADGGECDTNARLKR
jgi:hypothetical protein